MIRVIFKNLEKSEIARSAVIDRLTTSFEKFLDLKADDIDVTLEMENSPTQAGPDLFNVKIHVRSGRYKGTIVSKSSANMYKALAEISDHVLEILNREGDRQRVKARTQARRQKRIASQRA